MDEDGSNYDSRRLGVAVTRWLQEDDYPQVYNNYNNTDSNGLRRNSSHGSGPFYSRHLDQQSDVSSTASPNWDGVTNHHPSSRDYSSTRSLTSEAVKEVSEFSKRSYDNRGGRHRNRNQTSLGKDTKQAQHSKTKAADPTRVDIVVTFENGMRQVLYNFRRTATVAKLQQAIALLDVDGSPAPSPDEQLVRTHGNYGVVIILP